MKKDYKRAPLNERQEALCKFALKLTVTPSSMTQSDVQRMRDTGFSDRDVLDAVEVISYFNYINRVADGLGVDPEPWMKKLQNDS